MNNLFRFALKLNTGRSLLKSLQNAASVNTALQQRQLTRNLWYLCNSRNNFTENTSNKLCACGCMSPHHHAHSKAENDLVGFLTEEILTERKAQKSKTLPTELDGFQVKLNGAEVTLTKQANDETVKITFNVNHTVDTDGDPDLGELTSKPAFKIELIKGNTTLNLLCSFLNDVEENQDIFGLDEISIYDKEWSDNVYAVSGEVVDSDLYDLILNYLEEKGISNDFVEKLSQFSTSYEHSAYIGLLEGLSKFVSGK